MKKKKATPKSSPKQSQINNTTRVAQCRRIAAYLLEHCNATTIELASKCNAIHPPRRIYELRHDFGWHIETHWQRANDSQGRSHRVGNYVLKKAAVMP